VHVRIARAVQDQRTVSGGVGGELAHQAALAGSRLPADQDYTPTFAFGPGEERPELLQLGRATDERKRRGDPKRGRKIVHCHRPRSPR